MGHRSGVGRRVTWRRFRLWMVGGAIAGLLSVPVINAAVDPYDVFGHGLVRKSATANERVFKYRHLVRTEKYETLLMGSSVVGVIDPRSLSDRAYNASFFSATPADTLKMLQALDAAGRLPPRLVLGLDPFMFTEPKPGVGQMRLPPQASGESAWAFWRDYLFAASAGTVLGKLVELREAAPGVAFDDALGTYRLARFEVERQRDEQAYVQKRVRAAPIPRTEAWLYEPSLEDLDDLVRWLDDRASVEATYFLAPVHRRMRDALGPGLATLKDRTASIVGERLIDLSEAPISEDDRAWYETKHMTPSAATGLAADLARSKRLAWAGDER